MKFDIRECSLELVRSMVEKYHGYGAIGSAAYCFAVYEGEVPVASFSWLPPPAGAAKTVCPQAPFGVLALSRMVAVPREERMLKHISKPLMVQMKTLLDRTRWPVLVTYSDEGQGHNGWVYHCSGWEKTKRTKGPWFEDKDGKRQSAYSNGKTGNREGLAKIGVRWIQRWEHRVCPRGTELKFMNEYGWQRVAIKGKFYTSGNPAYTIRKVS